MPGQGTEPARSRRRRPATNPPPVGSTARGLSGSELLAAVRVHLDRVADAVRRTGCPPEAAVGLVRTSALELVEQVAARPMRTDEAVGWWFARATELGRRSAGRAPARVAYPGPVLGPDEQDLVEALEDLPDAERTALLLRDAYDLPATTVAAALGTDADGAMERVGAARLALLPLLDPLLQLPPPTNGGAAGRPDHATDPAALARLAEERPVAARDATARRHAHSCSSCRSTTQAQSQVHRLLSGLTVVALPEDVRAAVLLRVEALARQLLSAGPPVVAPASALLVQDSPPSRALSPLLAALSVVLAVLAGVGIGLATSGRDEPEALAGADGTLPAGVTLLAPPPAAPTALPSPPTVAEQRPDTSVVVVPAPALPEPSPPAPSPTPSPSPSPSPSPTAAATLALSSSTGPNGTPLTVQGTGFAAGAQVTVRYLGAAGQPTGSEAVAVADDTGAFTTQLAAQDPANEPGPHEVVATAGETTARAPFVPAV